MLMGAIEFVLVNGLKNAYTPNATKQENIEFYQNYCTRIKKVNNFSSIDDAIIKLSIVTNEKYTENIAQQLETIVGKDLRFL